MDNPTIETMVDCLWRGRALACFSSSTIYALVVLIIAAFGSTLTLIKQRLEINKLRAEARQAAKKAVEDGKLVKIPSSDEIDKALDDLQRWQRLRMQSHRKTTHVEGSSAEFLIAEITQEAEVSGSALSLALVRDRSLLHEILRHNEEDIHDVALKFAGYIAVVAFIYLVVHAVVLHLSLDIFWETVIEGGATVTLGTVCALLNSKLKGGA
jgi:hypothetical protein